MAIRINEDCLASGAEYVVRRKIKPFLESAPSAHFSACALQEVFAYSLFSKIKMDALPTKEDGVRLAEDIKRKTQDAVLKKDVSDLIAILTEDAERYEQFYRAFQEYLDGLNAPDQFAFETPSEAELFKAISPWIGDALERTEIVGHAVGGYSKQTVLFDAHLKNGDTVHLVIRRDLPHAENRSSVTSEFQILKAVFDRGLEVAEPLFLETDSNVLQTPFLISRRINGRTYGSALGPTESLDFNADRMLGALLAKLHMIDPRSLSIIGISDAAFSVDSVRQRIDEWAAIYRANVDTPTAAIEVGLAWLRENAHLIQGREVIVHGDVGYHNVLFHERKLTALLDWELARIGSPAEDIAYVAIAAQDEDEFLKGYEAAGGELPTHGAIVYCKVFGALRNSILGIVGLRQFNEKKHSDASALAIIISTFYSYMSFLKNQLGQAIAEHGFQWMDDE